MGKFELCAPSTAAEAVWGSGQHKHSCTSCSTTWKHVDDLDAHVPEDDFHLAHHCPSCGQEQYLKDWTAPADAVAVEKACSEDDAFNRRRMAALRRFLSR
jgi:hypothetical protein